MGKTKQPRNSKQKSKRQKIVEITKSSGITSSPDPAPLPPPSLKTDFPNEKDSQEISSDSIENDIKLPPDEPETFKKHPRFDGIEIGTLGTFLRQGQPIKTKLLYFRLNEAGYDKSGGARKIYRGIEMAKTFLGDPPSPYHIVKYRDGNNANCRLSNLMWSSKGLVLTSVELSTLNLKNLLPPFEKYQYGNDGHIYNNGYRLSEHRPSHIYANVALRDNQGKYFTRNIHTLIGRSEYFVLNNQPIPFGHIIVHINGIRKDNRPSNLLVQTRSQSSIRTSLANTRQVLATCLSDGKCLSFESVGNTNLHFKGIAESTIRRSCDHGRHVQFEGNKWTFRYIGDNSNPPKKPNARLAPEDRDWRRIPEFDLFEISEIAELRRAGAKHLLTQRRLDHYMHCNLDKTTVKIHYLMGITFCGPQPSAHHEIDHIDENKLHNCRFNLRWTDKNTEWSVGQPCERKLEDGTWQQFGSFRSAALQLVKESNTILQFDLENNPFYGPLNKENTQLLTKQIASKSINIGVYLKNPQRKTAFGYQWRALIRGPNVEYTCPDCHKNFTKRGNWYLPENTSNSENTIQE